MNRRAMIKPVRIRFAVAIGFALMAAACAKPAPEAPPLAGTAIGGPFTLINKAGATVRWSDFAGRYRIVYFGYTFCPDACPMDIGITMRGLAIFAKAHPALASQIQPMFITIDPARDTPAVVGQFAAAFSPRLLGLTGTPTQVDQAARAFAVYYAHGAGTPGGYLMDHSRIAYLMGRNGEPIEMLPIDKGPTAVATDLETWIH
jgi:protein SCO1/2